MQDKMPPEAFLGSLGLAGLIIGLGKLLNSTEELSPRLVLGRALTSAGLGVSAASLLLAFPEIPFVAAVGIACLISSLGTSAVERILQKLLGIK